MITNSEADDILIRAITTYKKSKLSLENVTITQAEDGIFAKSNSQVTVSGRLVSTKTTGVYTESGSVITVKDKAEIISSNGSGLHANGRQSKIKMIESTVNTKKVHYTLTMVRILISQTFPQQRKSVVCSSCPFFILFQMN
ncbi:hypothetical protein [Bartonella henselae]|uniref:hypothetical protein n=1 Tax=Bartonella henselae TaxID=38323 RepID=UPI00300D070D